MRVRDWMIGSALLLALSACGDKGADTAPTDVAPAADAPQDEAAPAAPDTDAATPVPAAPDAPAGLQDRDGQPVPELAFDLDSVPLSTQTLGALPVIALPAGYAPINRAHLRAWARFPFRLGDGVHWVEGRSWSAHISVERNNRDKEYSGLELRRNLEAVLKQAGAVQVFDGPLNRNIYYGPQLEDEIGGGFIDAVNMSATTPTQVHVIRLADRSIWFQISYDSRSAGMAVVEQIPFEPTARWSAAFPHLAMPAGYRERNRPKSRDYDMFPFWTGSAFEQVEGRTYELDFGKDDDAYSLHEVRRNLEATMAEAGGTLVFAGRIPKEASDSVDESVKQNYSHAAGFSWHEDEVRVYRADLADGRQVWVHANLGYMSAGYVVAERQGFVQTAGLLPAEALKAQLDAAGRVAIQVNFAVDKADILPDSQPQLDQVLALLQQDPALSLSIEGHTDDSGAAAHNRSLSQARARSVVAALTGKGIAADRLAAVGFGADKPVADNASEDGRAKNRRVELVRR